MYCAQLEYSWNTVEMSAGVISASSPEVFTLLVLTAAILSILMLIKEAVEGGQPRKETQMAQRQGGFRRT